MFTPWHGNTEGLALWSHSSPVGGSDLENITLSWCQAINGGFGGALPICYGFHPEWFNSRSIGQNILCVDMKHKHSARSLKKSLQF